MLKICNRASVIVNNGRVPMRTDMNMDSHKIISLADPSNATDATNKKYTDNTILKLSGGNITGPVSKDCQPIVHESSLLNFAEMKFWFVAQDYPYVKTRFNMVSHKIINLADPENDGDAVNKDIWVNINSNQVIKQTNLLI